MTILVIDDQKPVYESINQILYLKGYKVLRAESGPEALEFLEKEAQRIELIFLDINLRCQIMNGFDVCRRLKSNEETKDIPVVFISANEERFPEAREAGGDFCVAKPFEVTEIIDVVQRFACV